MDTVVVMYETEPGLDHVSPSVENEPVGNGGNGAPIGMWIVSPVAGPKPYVWPFGKTYVNPDIG